MSERPSWWQKLFARSKAAVTHEEVVRRLAEAERALRLAALEKPQAQADNDRLAGAAALLEAIGSNDAVVLMGSVLLIRRSCSTGPASIYIRNLVQSELLEIEQNPELLKNPQALHEHFCGISPGDEIRPISG